MQEIIAQNEAKAQIFHDFIAITYVPQLSDHLTKTYDYLDKEATDFLSIEEQCEKLLETIQEKKIGLSKTVKQLTEKIQRESDLQKKAETYKKAKKDELSAVQKTIDAISSAMKEACSKLQVTELKKISVLPEGMQSFLSKLFQMLYNEDGSKFVWNEFKAKAIEKDNGDDFRSRLANFQFRGVTVEKENFLLQMKDDPLFAKVYKDPKYANAFLDIADWIHYVVSGIENQKKRDETHDQFEKIEREFTARGKELQSLQKGLNFWQSSLTYAEDQITFLNQMAPQMKGVFVDIDTSKSNLDKHMGQFIQQTNVINAAMVPKI